MRKVLILDGETRASLAATRSIARGGDAVTVASAMGRSLAGASRYARGDISLGDGSRDPSGWASRLREAVGRDTFDSVLPITELSLGNTYRFGLHGDSRFICPPPASYERAVDKLAVLREAERIGIPVPATVLVCPDSVGENGAVPVPAFPVVLKPRRSRFWRSGAWCSGSAEIVHDRDAWLAALARPPLAGGALQQELVPGHGEGIFVLARDGEVLIEFAHRRLREHPPTGGQSVLRESMTPDPALVEMTRKLIGAFGWTGVAMIEFRRAPDGTPYLMEINPRLWGSVQLAIDAGVDFPRLLLALHRGEPVPSARARAGVKSRWLLGDLDHLLVSLRSARIRAQTGATVPRLLRDFLRSFFDDSCEEVLTRDDWRPFARELATWLRELSSRTAANGES